MDSVVLIIEGERFEGFRSIRISTTLEHCVSSFQLELTDRWQQDQQPRPIVPGDKCEIYCGHDPVLTGFVDDVEPSYDAESYVVRIYGRSTASDLVDCSSKRKQYQEQSLEQLTKTECQPFGIDVIVETDTGQPFKSITRDAGESIFEFLEMASRYRAVRFMNTPKGELAIIEPGSRRAAVGLELGKNILEARGFFSNRERFNEVTVLAQQPGAVWDAKGISEPKGVAQNPNVTRYRPLTILSQEPGNAAACKTRAQWQVNVQQGRAHQVSYLVNGWREKTGGTLWQINTLTTVNDPWIGINKEWLIVACNYMLDQKAYLCELTLAPLEGYKLSAITQPEDDLGWGHV